MGRKEETCGGTGMEDVEKSLDGMGIPYSEENLPADQVNLAKAFGYDLIPLRVDLSGVDTVDAEAGIVVRYGQQDVDNGIYIFTVMHSGKAAFLVVEPSTVSRAPVIQKVTGDMVSAITAVDFPPMTPFDMVEVTGHVLANTFMGMVMDSLQVPGECRQEFLKLYLPRFLSNVGMYFVGASREDGSPMVHERIVNMEPMMVWNSMVKGTAGSNEGKDAGAARKGSGAEETAGEKETGA